MQGSERKALGDIQPSPASIGGELAAVHFSPGTRQWRSLPPPEAAGVASSEAR